jgi:gamma-glutamylcyclotransferase (GGCT)/AIG2-like uncharacterized protein YtfP
MAENEEDTGILFVYGTLKVDTGPTSYARHFDKVRLGSKPATVKGVLYDMGYFPGLILGGDKIVYGELHRYSHFGKVIEIMDQIEGYLGKGDPENLYNRVKVQVLMTGNEATVTATAYEFAQSVKSYPAVADGIWEIDKDIVEETE